MKNIIIIALLCIGLIYSAQAQEEKKKSLSSAAVKKTEETAKPVITETVKKEKKSLSSAVVKTKEVKATAKNLKPMIGRVVSLNSLSVSKDGNVSNEQAAKLFSKGQPLLFKAANGKIYMVYNPDGSYAGKKLSMLADKEKLGIVGKVKVIHGVRVIIASKFVTAF